MKNFKRNKEFSSDRSFRKDKPFRKDGLDSRPRFNADRTVRPFRMDDHRSSRTLEMFDVTCAKCGKATQVPFKPMTSKPVYCRDCFQKNDSQEPRSFEKKQDTSSEELQIINMKLDKIMRALKIN